MHRIAIVEDNPNDAKLLKSFIERFVKEEHEQCEVVEFKDGVNFISDYSCNFEVIFMDIEMPFLDGMNTARKLRLQDDKVVIIFVTNVAQYAIEGYEVNALDFMIKPVSYFNFSMKLKRAFKRFESVNEQYIMIQNRGQAVRVPVSHVYYVEKVKNYLVYHTEEGEFEERVNLNAVEQKLQEYGFAKCNSGCMVNVRNVTSYNKQSVEVGGTQLAISRGQRSALLNMLFLALGD